MSGRGSGPAGSNRGWFRKGRSGNPGGRPRKRTPAGACAFDIVVSQTLTVTRKGVPREITMEEALQHRTYQDAIAGKRMARREVLRWIAAREAWLARHGPRSAPPLRVVHAHDSDNADAAMLLLGLAAGHPQRAVPGGEGPLLLLEPWAVQLALDRRRGQLPLKPEEIDDIRRLTRDPGRLRWPRGGDR